MDPYIAEMTRQINLCRTNPKSFIPDVMNGKFAKANKTETIAFLNAQPPLQSVTNDPFLNTFSAQYARQQKEGNLTGHGDFRARGDAIKATGATYAQLSECLSYGFVTNAISGKNPPSGSFNVSGYQGCVYTNGVKNCSSTPTIFWSSPREVVLQFIVDETVPDRGHRHNIYTPDISQMGVGYGPHPTYRFMVAILFAAAFTP